MCEPEVLQFHDVPLAATEGGLFLAATSDTSLGLAASGLSQSLLTQRWSQRPEEPVEEDDEPPRILKEVGQVGKVLCRDCLAALSSQTLEGIATAISRNLLVCRLGEFRKRT